MGKVKIHYPQSEGGIPAGSVVIWSGAATDIPSGWALCDGTNGTPDLRGRFVLGAGGKYGVGATGGEESHKLTISEMPSHNHSVQYSSNGGSWGSKLYGLHDNDTNDGDKYVGFSGGGHAHNNMPPYYVLCYIMKC